MVLWNKSPKTAIGRVVSVVTHHPVIVHGKGVAIARLAVDNNLIISNLKCMALVLLYYAAVEWQVLCRKGNCGTLCRYPEFAKVVLILKTGVAGY